MNDTAKPTQPDPARPAMDCEAAEIAIAARQVRTLAGTEVEQLDTHLATCERCRAATTAETRWLVRMTRAEFDGGPQLPIVDPSVFKIERELATGGMGRVSLATDRRLGRQVALKEILDPKLKVRFEREALITAHLQHPAIVPIYEAGTWPDGSAFYAMRLVAGTTLHEAIHEAKTLGERLALLHHVTAMVEAIAYAHGRRVIHRDLKTTNVLVGELGDTVVIDWGLAKSLDDGELEGSIPSSGVDLTRVGAVMGTPGFMAPEQARGEATDERADVFALGAILYTLLAGQPPYLSDGVDTAIARVSAGPPRSIAALAPEAPKDLHAICERAMAHRPEDRYANARELATELRRFEAGQLLARPYSIRELIGRWFRRHRALVLGGAVSLIAVVIIGTLAIVNITRSRAAEREAREQAEAALLTAVAGEAAALEEQARVSLLNGDRDPALVLLHQALLRGRDTPALRYLLAVTLRDRDLLDREEGTFAEDVIASDGLLVLDGTGAVRRGDEQLFVVAPNPVHAMFFRDRLVVQGDDRSLACWNVETGQRVWHHGAHATKSGAGQIELLRGAQDRVVFVGEDEKSLTVRALETGALIKRIDFPDEIVKVVARWDLLAVSVRDDRVRVFGEELTLVRTVTAKSDRFMRMQLEQIAFLDASHLVTLSDNLATISDLDASEPSITLVHDVPVFELATHAKTDRIVTVTTAGTIRVWSATGQLLGIAHVPNRLELKPVISEDGETLLTDTAGGLDFWELPGLTQRVSVAGPLASAQVSDYRFSVVERDYIRILKSPSFGRRESYRSNGSAFVGDELMVTYASTDFYRSPHYAHGYGRREKFEVPPGAWQSSPRRLLSVGVRGVPSLVEFASGRVHTFETKGSAALSPDGGRLAIAGKEGLEIIDAETTARLRRRELPEPNEIAFVDDRHLVVAGDDNVTLIDTETLAIKPFADGRAYTIHVADGRVTLCRSKSITVHDASGRVLSTLDVDDDYVRLTRDGTLLASQGNDGAIELFELATSRSIARFPAAIREAFALSADGALVFTGNADGTVRVYEARTGRELEVRKVHRRPVKQLGLSPDGKTLLADVWHHDEFPRDEVEDHTATLLEVERDTHTIYELAALVAKTGWIFDGGIPRKL